MGILNTNDCSFIQIRLKQKYYNMKFWDIYKFYKAVRQFDEDSGMRQKWDERILHIPNKTLQIH